MKLHIRNIHILFHTYTGFFELKKEIPSHFFLYLHRLSANA